jgi:hypothetical protein
MYSVLNQREKDGVSFTLAEYNRRFGKSGVDDPNLFVHLGDNPDRYLCWSAVSKRIPTFRTGAGKVYCPHRELWLLPKDRLACLGYPVVESMARSMGVPGLPVADVPRAAAIAGNAFHFGCVAIIQLTALACFTLIDQ